MRMLTQDLLAVLFGETPADEALVQALASTPDYHAELIRLAVMLAELPGDGAREAEARLDALFDAVARAVADSTTLCWPALPGESATAPTDSAAPFTEPDHNPQAHSEVLKSIDTELRQLDDPDLTVIRLIAEGERVEALLLLVRHFGDTIYKLCLAMSHDRKLADDETLHLFEQTYRDLQETVARGRKPPQYKGYFRDQLIALLAASRQPIYRAPYHVERDLPAPGASSSGPGHVPPPSWKARLFQEFAPGELERRKSST